MTLDLSKNVTRTALDALHAKASTVLNAGYRPVVLPPVVQQQQQGAACVVDEYIDLIRRAVAIGNIRDDDDDDAGVIKRQTPLVHAGYALRIQAILSTIGNFASIVVGGGSRRDDKKNENDDVDMSATIILLGIGMDVTGLWAARTFPHVFGHVIEIDLPTVGASKRAMLQRQSLVDFESETTSTLSSSSSTATRPAAAIHHGTVTVYQHSSSSAKKTTFALVEADLRDHHDWKSVLEGVWNPHAPTLVISEVVLAYLGKDENAVNDVLSGWATALQQHAHPDSCLVLLEPMGPDSTDSTTPNGVLHSYQLAYSQMFQSKLHRGVVSGGNNKKAVDDDRNAAHACFAPIGSSPDHVARRLRNTGWDCAVAVSLAKATSSSTTTTQSSLPQANEPFDEHAALLLYAQSYVVACACSTSASASCWAALFRRIMAPWRSTHVPPPFQATENLWIATIDRTEEATVKALFVDGYEDLCKTSKSVRKLVKGALKKDFILTKTGVDGIDFTSNFAKYYQNRGGCFLVAIDAATRQIVGFVALCKVASPSTPTTAASCPNSTYFEIQRLFVVAEYRSKGVAGHLMNAVQQFALAQSRPGAIVTFLATTLNVLKDANRFYNRRGFTFRDEVPLQDNVTIYNYMLEVQKPTSRGVS